LSRERQARRRFGVAVRAVNWIAASFCGPWATKFSENEHDVALKAQKQITFCAYWATINHRFAEFDALGLQMTNLADVSDMLKAVRHDSKLSQEELARRAGVARTTVARMETLAKNDMSVSVLVRLLEAAGYDLKFVAHGHGRTLEDILAEQRSPDAQP
jgi:DNA-binding XRE family transcriptional regulator